MKRNTQANDGKILRYSLRKYKLGLASVTIGAIFLSFSAVQVVKADEAVSTPESSTQLEPADSCLTTSGLVTETPAAPVTAENTSVSKVNEPVSLPEENTSPTETSKLTETSENTPKTVSTNNSQALTNASEDPIAEGTIRLHFQELPSQDKSSLGLWTWDDVETPSSQKGAWPTGATSFAEAKQDDYGVYLDVKLSSTPKKLSFLINNAAGTNLSGDKAVEILSPQMNEAWIDKDFQVYSYQPIPQDHVRINYFRTDGDYSNKSVWYWGDVKDAPSNWPDGVNFQPNGKYGAYLDIPLTQAAKSIGFLLLDESKTGDDVKIQPNDYKFSDLKKSRQLFVRDTDPTVYTNPYFVKDVRLTGVQQLSPSKIELSFTNLDEVSSEDILKDLKVTDKDGNSVTLKQLDLDAKLKKATLTGDFAAENLPYKVTLGSDSFKTSESWQLKDALYSYDGELGARLEENGTKAHVTLWSPSADQVDIIVYDKNNQDKVLAEHALSKGPRGTWQADLLATDFGLENLTGYFYQYRIKRGDQSVIVLDPYAKSLAAWNSDDANKGPEHKIAKAAFVDPANYGPKDLDYAKIPNFKSREDAIIYEAHVRDFTSDKAISAELKHQFGTFAAFAERLDYLKDLGVTHIQLLPVLSYYFVNELQNGKRLDDYASSDSNYNWGYDPQNYFSLTGMYSENPSDPAKRIEEFKNLVAAIHAHGMGVILDVVYNHTAKTAIFEDLEPNYYHFMDADGTPRSSFGGGRLGTTHYMSRRVLVDSIAYLTKEYKVDGFRFDMMGDHDAESIEQAYNTARALNPNLIMLGEGWVTYAGDENSPVQPADQSWMKDTDTVAVFSDDIRNTLKSGYPNEGTPAFITGGKRDINKVFDNIKAQPTNFEADSPGDVIQYIAAHDNLTLFDIIAQSIKKDPSKPENNAEIHRRLRLGNLMVLTAQGTPFIHSGQEYGRTKQFRDPAYRYPVSEDKVPNKSHLLVDEKGNPFDYPYFIHDSYDSSDAVNHFDWTKATDSQAFPENTKTRAFTKGLIALRKSTDAFNFKSKADVDARVTLLTVPGQDNVAQEDLVLGYQTVASNGDRYLVYVNADSKARQFDLSKLTNGLSYMVLADGNQVNLSGISELSGVAINNHILTLDPLTATIIRLTNAQTPTEEVAKPSEKTESFGGKETEVTKTSVKTSSQEDLVGDAELVAHGNNQAETEASRQTGKQLPSTGEKTNRGLFATGLLSILSLGFLRKRRTK